MEVSLTVHSVRALGAAARLGEAVSSLIFADDFFTEPLDEPAEASPRLTPSLFVGHWGHALSISCCLRPALTTRFQTKLAKSSRREVANRILPAAFPGLASESQRLHKYYRRLC